MFKKLPLLSAVALLLVTVSAIPRTAFAQQEIMTTQEVRAIVRNAYIDILERSPDRKGLETYSEFLMVHGKDEAWLRESLKGSSEYSNLISAKRKHAKQMAAVIILSLIVLGGIRFLSRTYPGFKKFLIKFCAMLLVSLAMGEVALRMAQKFRPSSIFYSDSYSRHRGKPHAIDWGFALNSQGFKDVEITGEKGDDFRLLGLGDSFAFGIVPYENNYLTLLQENLSADERRIDVINMGIPSIGPGHYLEVLVREGLPLEPDFVLVSFFIGNDFTDAERKDRHRKWYTRTYVTSLLYYLFKVKSQFEGTFSHRGSIYCDDCPTMDEKTYLSTEKGRGFIFKKDHPKMKKHVKASIHYLNKINNICKRSGIGFCVAIIPDEQQVNAQLQEDIIMTYYSDQTDMVWDWDQPNRLLTDELKRSGIDFIDLLPAFREHSSSTNLYKPRDTHWNIAGNALAAELLSGYLQPIVSE